MKRVLVTGSSGKLGKEIVRLLRMNNYNILGIDLIESDTTDEIIDIRDRNIIKEVTKGVDAIIHTAALHGKHTDLNYSRDKFIETNINGTNNLLSASVENRVRKFLYTSTTSIYGTAMVSDKQAVWVDEELIPQPRDIYDITKLTCELLCKDYFEKEGIETTVLRVSRFLPEDDNTKANHRIYRGLDEEDGAKGHQLALEKKFSSFEIYNISNESPFKKDDLSEIYSNPQDVICKYYPEAEEFYRRNNWKYPEKIDRVYSIAKAKRDLNYQPKNNFDTFLK
ncbi:NAD(P)-dependent oxidoreductase [Adhaeribacter swui]|uniref:NAD(P)-dependent oxidoreductase n=1 Tax=Adhaeribacter swui TaxID=2086471 RepID=A0A7G7GA48_9BACT|nr:NAD(P)-dependent oxidoreductase [Adhaeribacter swui]QNF34032.1 NAD(P)-dependent oxidoreductase [Adhaeribacter swui]